MRRRYDKEMMDDMSAGGAYLDRALDELRIINLFLGGRSTSRKGMSELLRSSSRGPLPEHKTVTVLDVGAGGSDLFDARADGGRALEVISVDLNAGVCRYVKDRGEGRLVLCADARALPFRENSVDVVHASLFLHHFTEEEIVRLLTGFLRVARLGVVVNDLQRSYAALAGITALTRLFSRSSMVINDGPLSVKRGFARAEMVSILNALPCASYTLTWRWAFRWLAVIRKEAGNER